MLFFSKKDESVLYGYFHEFHSELLGIRERLQREDWAAGGEDDFPDNIPFRRDLIDLLTRQEYDAARRAGSHGVVLYKELKYAIVAFTDEFFIHLLDWDGKALWRKHLLEEHLFNSHAAGQGFFTKADRLIAERDPVNVELARIYLLILALGFEGEYRDRDDKGDLTRYRRSLYYLVTRREPEEVDQRLLHDADLRVFPAAYEPTLADDLQHPVRNWLPSASRWRLGLVLLLALGLLSSLILWHRLSGEVYAATDRILKDSRGLGLVEEAPPATRTPQASLAELQRERRQRERAERETEAARERIKALQEKLAAQTDSAAQAPPPAPPPPKPVKREYTLSGFSFKSGQTDLDPGAMGQIDQLADYLQQRPGSSALIKGYTDNLGDAQLNLELSLDRASAVSEALQARGIAADRLTATGYGEGFPVASNATREGRRKNRRVVIEVTTLERDAPPPSEAFPVAGENPADAPESRGD